MLALAKVGAGSRLVAAPSRPTRSKAYVACGSFNSASARRSRGIGVNLAEVVVGKSLGKACSLVRVARFVADPSEFAQPLHKSGDPMALDRRCARAQETDGRQLSRLLRSRRERP